MNVPVHPQNGAGRENQLPILWTCGGSVQTRDELCPSHFVPLIKEQCYFQLRYGTFFAQLLKSFHWGYFPSSFVTGTGHPDARPYQINIINYYCQQLI